jgi:hypothetical protein
MTANETTAPAPDVTWQAAFDAAEQNVIILRDIRAGICGPWGPEMHAEDLAAAEAALTAAGFEVATPWSEHRNGERLCQLAPIPSDPLAGLPDVVEWNA